MTHYDPDWQSKLNSRYLLDLIERVGFTFLQAFGAQLIASGWFTVDGVTDLAIIEKAGVAGIAAVLSVIKGLVARGVGSENTAALLPEPADTPRP